MKYRDLRDFMGGLERAGELKRVAEPVSVRLEMTAVSDFVLRASGPALWFQHPAGYKISALTNLFGTPRRVALGMGATEVSELRDVGRLLASLKEPEPPKGLKDAGKLLQMAKALWDMKPAQRAPRAVPGGGCRRRRRRPRHAAGADLLARRRRPADHLGPGHHARAAGRAERAPAPEPGHLPPAGDRPAPGHHALARPPRRRARLPRLRARQARPALPDRGGARCRPGDHPRRGDAGARHACPNTSSPACCAAAAPRWSTPASATPA